MLTVDRLRPPSPPSGAGAPRLGYQAGLDGLRAVSVLAVVLYHLRLDWIPGGFLGVEVFFVISGFLITALLIEERDRHGSISLRQFWLRRARRLLPALWLLLAAVTAYALWRAPDALDTLRAEVLAALAYVTNWYLVFSEQSYFDQLGRPPLFQHLWSLAVEEQWYLLWPVVFAGLVRWVRGDARRLVLPLLGLAAASSALMALLFVPETDPSRVYYGTDTRAAGLLVGAALACWWAPWRGRRPGFTRSGPELEALGLLAVGVLVLCFLKVDEFLPGLYRGGFLLVALVTAVAIAAVVDPRSSALRAALGWSPLRWIGVRSYGLYLWHWPVFWVLRPQDVGIDGWPLIVVRLGVTVLLTEVSFRLVETPVRSGALGRLWRTDRPRLVLGGGTALASVAVLGALVLAHPVPPAPGASATESLAAAPPAVTTAPGLPPVSIIPAAAPVAREVEAEAAGPEPASAPVPQAPLPRRVVVVGDSVGRTMVRNAPPELARTLSLADGSIEGCGIVDGAIRTVARWRRSFDGCAGWEQRWASAAIESRAEIALVTIGAWDVFDLQQGDTRLVFGTPASDAYLRGRIAAGIAALRATGAKVALLEVPCFRPVDGGGLRALPERGDRARTARLNRLLQEAAAADPTGVTFVRQPEAWCTDEAVATGLRYRWDGVHYDRPGAALVWEAVAPQLLAIDVPAVNG